MEIKFDKKVALITGAAGGIGFETAKMFAESGASVALVDLNKDLLEKSTKTLKDKGFDVESFVCDVSIENDVKNLIEKVVERFKRLDFAYNNVGVHAAVKDKMANTDRIDFDSVLNINLGGVWNCMKYEILAMQKFNNGGSIVNCSSQGGVVGIEGINAYCASKHAIIGLTKSAALDYAREGIRINAIAPGTCETPMVEDACKNFPEHMAKVIDDIPLGRMGKACEIASMVLWLCSEYSGFAVGQTISIDGGYTVL